MGWNRQQVKIFVQQVRDEARDGWQWITPRLRAALIAEKAFTISRHQAAVSVSVEAMNELLNAMLDEARCLEEEGE
jgi:hypothetical protein